MIKGEHMDINLKNDLENINILMEKIKDTSCTFLNGIDKIPSVPMSSFNRCDDTLSLEGVGTESALEEFRKRFYEGITSSSGPRYFGFVTGGSTPAALMGDWLVSAFDQNATARDNSSAALIEEEAIKLLKKLFGLSDEFTGTFVTGATMANFVGLAIGRQWAAKKLNYDIAQNGIYGMQPINIVSATPHSSILKSLSMLGMGRGTLNYIPCVKAREAIDIEALEKYLKNNSSPCIVVANAGTVNTVDFDDLKKLSELKKKYVFYLHVDAAFGSFAACSPKFSSLLEEINSADSITIDAHKWLNVPYDCAMQFTKHPKLQLQVFQNNAVYLGEVSENPDFVHLTPENSRRLRALPVWFTLKAYGKKGYEEIVERNCSLAQMLTESIRASKCFNLLAETRLNVVCFTINSDNSNVTLEQVQKLLNLINKDGKAFFTQTIYKGTPGIRAAICNWRTEEKDIEIAFNTLREAYSKLWNGLIL